MKIFQLLLALSFIMTNVACIQKFEVPSKVKFGKNYFNEDSILLNYGKIEKQNTKFKTIGDFEIGGKNNLQKTTFKNIGQIGEFMISDEKDMDGNSIIIEFSKLSRENEKVNFYSYILAFSKKYGPYSYYYITPAGESVIVWLREGVQIELMNFLNFYPKIKYRSLNKLVSDNLPVLDSTLIRKDDNWNSQKRIKDSINSKSTNAIYDNL